MKIIVLSGESNSGKTTTLKLLIETLCDYGWSIISPEYCLLRSIISSVTEVDKSLNKDITAVLVKDGKKIGVSTFGDDELTIKNKVEFFEKIGCECAVIGSHPFGSSKRYIEKLEKDDNNTVITLNKIGCKGEKKDWKFKMLCDISDRMSVGEIISYIIMEGKS